MIGYDETKKWSEAFTRTSRYRDIDYCAGRAHVWHNRYVLDVPSIPTDRSTVTFSGSQSSQDFADGGTANRSPAGFGTPSYRVHGAAAMRFLCHVHGIEEPARALKGEPFKPDTDILGKAVLVALHTVPSERGQSIWIVRQFWELLRDMHLEAGIDVEWHCADDRPRS